MLNHDGKRSHILLMSEEISTFAPAFRRNRWREATSGPSMLRWNDTASMLRWNDTTNLMIRLRNGFN